MTKGLLLINLGTPDSPEIRDVRRYLSEFLTDKRVVTLPWVLRYLLVYLFILPFRPQKSAKNYQLIWTDEGSPLLSISKKLCSELQKKLGDDYQVALGMRYGQPSIKNAVESLKQCDSITILPLFPQFASASTGTALEQALSEISKLNVVPSLNVISSFYQHPAFIQAQAELINKYRSDGEHFIFSYHGIPEQHIIDSGCKSVCQATCPSINTDNANCYRAQCYETSRTLARILELSDAQYTTAFQSRLGKTPWIQPYTDIILTDLIQKGIKRLVVSCPSFVTDCLETLEEINIRLKMQWLNLGGESLTLVPALNADAAWVSAIQKIVGASH